MRTVLTYGTFDLFHIGHLNMIRRLAALGDRLVVGVSTDSFNSIKGKHSIFSYDERAAIVSALGCVDIVIPEESWQQKTTDIEKYSVNVFGIGNDWKGKFDDLKQYCDVIYLERTPRVSSTLIKNKLSLVDDQMIKHIQSALDSLGTVVNALG